MEKLRAGLREGKKYVVCGTAVEEGAIIHVPPKDANRIGKMVAIGHSAIVHGKQIGNQAVIGMGAVISIRSEIGEWAIVAEEAL